MKKVIIMLLMIFVSNSCIPHIINEIRKEDWKEGWWWNQKYPERKPKPLVKVTECNKKGVCKEKHTRYPIYRR